MSASRGLSQGKETRELRSRAGSQKRLECGHQSDRSSCLRARAARQASWKLDQLRLRVQLRSRARSAVARLRQGRQSRWKDGFSVRLQKKYRKNGETFGSCPLRSKTLVFLGFFACLANCFGFPAYPCLSMPAGAASSCALPWTLVSRPVSRQSRLGTLVFTGRKGGFAAEVVGFESAACAIKKTARSVRIGHPTDLLTPRGLRLRFCWPSRNRARRENDLFLRESRFILSSQHHTIQCICNSTRRFNPESRQVLT